VALVPSRARPHTWQLILTKLGTFVAMAKPPNFVKINLTGRAEVGTGVGAKINLTGPG
jgi:hypothetical protein